MREVRQVTGNTALIAAMLLTIRMAFAAERFLIGGAVRIGNGIGT